MSWIPSDENTAGSVTFYDSNQAVCNVTDDTDTIKVTAIEPGKNYNKATIAMTNTVAAGAETLTWTGDGTSSATLVIAKAATSTLTQILAAAGGVTGTAWGTLSAVGTAGNALAAALSATAMENLYSFTGGYLNNTRK